MGFYVGQRVICVRDDFQRPDWDGLNTPISGHVYTVRAVVAFRYRYQPAAVEALLLKEIRNPAANQPEWRGEIPFWAVRFQPAPDACHTRRRETDIKIFEKMLVA